MEITVILENACPLRNLHKWIGRRHCWLQKLLMWQDLFLVLLHITWLFVHVPCYINHGHVWEVRESTPCTHTQGCWTLPFPGVYRCYPLLNDVQVGRSSATGQGGSHTFWGSFVRMWTACFWAVLLQKVYYLYDYYADSYKVNSVMFGLLVEKFWDSLRWKSIQNFFCEVFNCGIWSQIKLYSFEGHLVRKLESSIRLGQ